MQKTSKLLDQVQEGGKRILKHFRSTKASFITYDS